MKVNEAPEKIYVVDVTFPDYVDFDGSPINTKRTDDHDIEYTRTDAFIEKTLKWYCLDCECNDNCKDTKCFFYREYERYLKGGTNNLPPKFSGRILNEDGSTSDNWHYRHFVAKIQDAFIEKACEYISEYVEYYIKKDKACNVPLCPLFATKSFIEDFKNYMKEE